jgi:hypothetical protein
VNKLYAFALGLAKSKTITFAVLLGILGSVQMYVDVMRPLFHTQAAFGYFCMGLAVVVGVLRAVTYQSLSALGSGATNGEPPAESG